MGGIMPERERDAAIKRLRQAAHDAIAYKTNTGRRRKAIERMKQAWFEFPECERDRCVPLPEEVLRACDSYDRQKEEAERIVAGGLIVNKPQTNERQEKTLLAMGGVSDDLGTTATAATGSTGSVSLDDI